MSGQVQPIRDDLAAAAERVKAKAKRARARATVDVALPIYDGLIVARFGLVGDELLGAFSEVEDDTPEMEAAALCAKLIAESCRELFERDGGELRPLGHRFDQAFAEAFALPRSEDSMVGVVFGVFTLDDGTVNTKAIASLAVSLVEWMRDTTAPMEGELLGESPGGRR